MGFDLLPGLNILNLLTNALPDNRSHHHGQSISGSASISIKIEPLKSNDIYTLVRNPVASLLLTNGIKCQLVPRLLTDPILSDTTTYPQKLEPMVVIEADKDYS